jgi:hypothetical protein
MTLREVPGLNRECERIIKKTAFLTVEDPCGLLQGSSINQQLKKPFASTAPPMLPSNSKVLSRSQAC